MGGLFGGNKNENRDVQDAQPLAAHNGHGQPGPPMAPSSQFSWSRQMMKLVACVGLDFMGNSSYFLPAVGEVGDAAFAPAQAVALKMMFDANGLMLLGFAEEILPYTDIMPTATIAWTIETFMPNSPMAKVLGIHPHT